ncbi:MAG TPA: hypothetical protein VKU00_24025, partial [Chthonomonadaceae bacterium]|nr:hypothetical protein [Chthonomonadaceae bacterium]
MMETMEKTSRYAEQFAEFEREATGGPLWLAPLRKAAFSRFAELGFPTRHDEEWRFTNPAPLVETEFALPGGATGKVTSERIAPLLFGGTVLVCMDGRYAPELSVGVSLPQGVRVRGLAEALETEAALLEPHLGRYAGFENQAFTALNTAFLQDGAFVHIPRNTIIETPIHLLYVSI